MQCPNCNDFVDEQGVCHTCQTQTVKPEKQVSDYIRNHPFWDWFVD